MAAEGLNLLTKKAIREGLLDAAVVGNEKVVVSHIQYADDMLFSIAGNERNVEAVKWVLKSFELVLGLAVNVKKSCMFGINLERERL